MSLRQPLRPAPASRAESGLATAERNAPSGDRDALTLLLREHGPAIQQLCYFVAGAADAADATQESFERLVSGITKFNPDRGPFRSWAFTVARNVCRDRLRRRGLERKTFAAGGDELVAISEAAVGDPERALVVRSDAARLSGALAELPESHRTALVMFHFQHATYEEIAAVLEVPIGTVMTWIHRGRKRLREALADEGQRALDARSNPS